MKVSHWPRVHGPLWLFPDVVSIIYPASNGQYWSRLWGPLPHWQQRNERGKEEAAVSPSPLAQSGIQVRCCHLALTLLVSSRSEDMHLVGFFLAVV